MSGSPWLSVGVTAAVCLLWTAVALWTVVAAMRRGDDGEDGDGGGGGGGGSGGGRPVPPPPGSDGDFDWWPEFESSFADYVAARTARV